MRLLACAGIIAFAVSALAQPITESDRYGKTYGQVAEMGHVKWVEFFCDPSRAGVNGRVQAEKIFAIAIHQSNEKRVSQLPKSEQDFYQDCWLHFANLAKSAFTINTSLYPNWEGNSLLVAESGTKVNLTIRSMLNAPRKLRRATLEDVLALHAQGNETLGQAEPSSYPAKEYRRLKGLAESLANLLEGRSKADQYLAFGFASDMVRYASARRDAVAAGR